MNNKNQLTLHIDLDGTLMDLHSAIEHIDSEDSKKSESQFKSALESFAFISPKPGAVEAYKQLSQYYKIHIVSTDCQSNANTWLNKVNWVKRHFGEEACNHLIFTQDYSLLKGNYLIDARNVNEFGSFDGIQLQLGSEIFPDWECIKVFLLLYSLPSEYTDQEKDLSLLLHDEEEKFLGNIRGTDQYYAKMAESE